MKHVCIELMVNWFAVVWDAEHVMMACMNA